MRTLYKKRVDDVVYKQIWGLRNKQRGVKAAEHSLECFRTNSGGSSGAGMGVTSRGKNVLKAVMGGRLWGEQWGRQWGGRTRHREVAENDIHFNAPSASNVSGCSGSAANTHVGLAASAKVASAASCPPQPIHFLFAAPSF